MTSGLSFRSYDKVDGAQETAFWRNRSRKRIVIISVSSLLLLVIIIAAVVGTTVNHGEDSGGSSTRSGPPNSIKLACAGARDPPQCEQSLAANGGANDTDPAALFVLSLKIALAEFSLVKDFPAKLANATNDTMVQIALNDCQLLINDSVEQLNASLETASTNPSQTGANQTVVDELRIWLSAALTNIDTCFDGLENTTGGVQAVLQAAVQNSTLFTSNSLAIVTQLSDILTHLGVPHRRLLSLPATDAFPAWVSGKDPKLLQANAGDLRPDVTVSKDGSGDVRTIADALKKAPTFGSKRFVIYVKQGVYEEYVTVAKKTLVMLVGDGMYKTVVTGSRSVGAYTTFTSATFTVFGNGFMARDIGFKNTAGAAKHQAVALLSKSDNSVFDRCSFEAFQDTLYVHTGRQFYRECRVTGTVDFIFGNAAAVFQNCAISPTEPMAGQFDTITAQSKSDKNMPTGMSFHMCQIDGSVKARVYFGRPWKTYATVVVMKTSVGSLLTPAGWLPWTGNTIPSTVYYAEYANTGPGASTKGRVNCKGYHPSLTDQEASKFTVGSFIGGSSWLRATGVPFQAGL